MVRYAKAFGLLITAMMVSGMISMVLSSDTLEMYGTSDILPPSIPAAQPFPSETDRVGKRAQSEVGALLDGYFIENKGQNKDPGILFYTQTRPISIEVGASWVRYMVQEGTTKSAPSEREVTVRFENARDCLPFGDEPLDHETNFFIGRSQDEWVTGAGGYREVVLPDLWDRIDLRFSIVDGSIKYEFQVRPGGDPGNIRMEYSNIDRLEISTATANLEVHLGSSVLIDKAPVSYQELDDVRFDIDSSFRLVGDMTVGFSIGEFDPDRDLIIDPGLEFSTYMGGSGREWSYVDDALHQTDDGSIIVAGTTGSPDLPVTNGAYCSTYNSGGVGPPHKEGFVAKFNHNVSELLFLTYFGGTDVDFVTTFVVDDNGSIILTGYTSSPDFPVTYDAYKGSLNSTDGYILILNNTGSDLVYSSYIGGSDVELFNNIEIDDNGNLVIVGFSGSFDFPVTNGAYCTTHPSTSGDDMIILTFSRTHNDIIYATYFGGTGGDVATDVEIDGEGNIVTGGVTTSDNLPVTDEAYSDEYSGMGDVVIFKMTSDLSTLLSSSYYGGADNDYLNSIEVAPDGSVWFCGSTASSSIPVTSDGLQPRHGGGTVDGFFAKLSHNLSILEYSSYIGGSGPDRANDLLLVGSDEVIVATSSRSPDMITPVSAMYRRYLNGVDGYMLWLNVTSGRPINASYLYAAPHNVIRSAMNDIVIISGYEQGGDLPTTPGSFDRVHHGDMDLFILGMTMDRTPFDLPTVPINLTAIPMDNTVKLMWDEPAEWGYWNIMGYNLYMGAEEGHETLHETFQPKTEHFSYGLENGQRYHFRLAAYSIVGEGILTPSVEATPFGIPSAPIGFKVEAGCGTVTLSWSPPIEMGGLPMIGYHIFRGPTENHMERYREIGNVTSFLDVNVTKGTVYHYAINCFHRFANGTISPVVDARPYGPPDAPVNEHATGGDGNVTLTWDPPPNDGGFPVIGYKVLKGATSGAMGTLDAIGPFNTYTDDAVANGNTYYYAIAAITDIGTGPLTSVMAVTPFGIPGQATQMIVAEDDGLVILSWEPPIYDGGSDIIGYRVLRGVEDGPLEHLDDVLGGLSYEDDSVENGVTYWYSILAFSLVGDGEMTEAIEAVPMAPPTEPSSFDLMVDNGQVTLVWLPPYDDGGSGIQNYRLYRGIDPKDLTLIDEIPGSQNTYLDGGLDPGIAYLYQMTAINARYEGSPTQTLSALIVGVPGPPLGLMAIPGDDEITLSWQPPETDGGAAIEGYNIYIGTTPDDLVLNAQAGAGISYTVRGLENGVEYHLSVSARNVAGEGPSISSIPAVPLGLPGAPVELTVKAYKSSVTLIWSAPEDDGGTPILGYVLVRGSAPDDMDALFKVGQTTTYTDFEVKKGQTYFYTIVAVNAVGEGDRSQTIDVELKATAVVPDNSIPQWALIIGLAGMLIGLAAVASTEPGKYRLALIGVPLMSRNSKDEVLNNKNRYAIHGLIIDKPGIHYNAILKEFELTAGVVTYHLDVLEKERFIRSVRDGRLKRFYSARAKVPKDQRMTPEEIRESIVEMVKERPDISQMELIEELGIDRNTVGYHVRELVKEGRLKASKEWRYTVYRVR